MYHDKEYWKKEFQAAGAEILLKKIRIEQLYRFLENESSMIMTQMLNGKGEAETKRLRERAVELMDISEKLVNAIDEYDKLRHQVASDQTFAYYLKENIIK